MTRVTERSRWLHVVLLIAVGSASLAGCANSQRLSYPHTRTVDHVDVYHGVEVADPYRWLEDADSDETKAWVKAENEVTFGYLNKIPARKKIRERLTEIWNYEKFGQPQKKGGKYFYTKNDGLQNQSVLFVADTLTSTPRVLLDPNTLSKDGTISLTGIDVSEDGKHMAYGLASAGSDWQEWRVRDVETGKDTKDHVKWVKFSSASWTKDGKGFFYSRYDEPKKDKEFQDVNFFQKLYYHQLGTPQADDILVYDRPDKKEWGFNGSVTDDGQYLVISVRLGTERKNLIFYKDLQASAAPTLENIKNAPVVELISEFESQYVPIDNQGPVFWLRTDKDAPRGRVVAVDLRNPGRANWKELIPQSKETLRGVSSVGGKLVASYLKDAYSQVKVFDANGSFVRNVAFPGLGTARGFGGSRKENETFYSYSSYTDPGTIYRYSMATGESSVFRRPEINFDFDQYETSQVFYRSKDGTSIPMFITHKKGLSLDGQNPTILYGYGGFNIPITPRFRVSTLVWLEMGGVYAVANLRGGGEYGKAWHSAGKKLKKQNVFDDFIAASEWLIDRGYTSSSKLAIHGGSNGGLLVGACMVQRPDLFGACLPAVGVLDMLRFPEFTIGWAWTSDYGSPKNPEEFKALYAYSPYHNTKPGTAYPATMITTGDHDDRVVPAHSFKFAAALQKAHVGNAPTLIRIETRAGHGAGKPTSMRIEEDVDRLGFLVETLEITQ